MKKQRAMFGRFWRWWTSALGQALIPPSDPFATGTVCLRRSEEGFDVVGDQGPEGTIPFNEKAGKDVMRRVRMARRVYLDLDEELVLHIKGSLPLAAQDDPREAFALRIAELTPFSEHEVFFDVTSVVADKGDRLSFRAFVTPRQPVRDQIDLLGRIGIVLDGVVSASSAKRAGTAAPDFLPEISRRRFMSRAIALTACIGLLLVATGWLAFAMAERQAAVRQSYLLAIEMLVSDLRQAEELEAEISNMSRSLSRARTRMREEIQPLELLESTARALPDEIYLDSFSRSDDEIIMSGFATDATAVIGLLEDLTLLENVRFSTPVMRDESRGLDRFTVRAMVRDRDAEVAQ